MLEHARSARRDRITAHVCDIRKEEQVIAMVDGLLEHPDEAFGYYRAAGIARVVCQEKHMGSISPGPDGNSPTAQ